jgi:glycosyltransferase involved in cell wall biosynthesis
MEAPVSVVIPCYRCADTIARAVESIAKQTLLPTEVILVDDCSQDNTLKILDELQNQYPTNWIKIVALEKNGGASIARNTGWNMASQDYIAFLDADDTWHPEKIKVQYKKMQANYNLIFSSHLCEAIQTQENLTYSPLPKTIETNLVSPKRALFFSLFPTTSTIVIKRDIDRRFKPDRRYCEDSLLWLDILLSGGQAAIIQFPLAYRYRPFFSRGGLGGNLWKMEVSELDNYRIFWHSGYINFISFIVLSLWSLAKYYRRVLIEILRNIRRHKIKEVS